MNLNRVQLSRTVPWAAADADERCRVHVLEAEEWQEVAPHGGPRPHLPIEPARHQHLLIVSVWYRVVSSQG